MKATTATVGTIAFAVVVPGTVAGVVPWWLAGGRVHPPLGGTSATRAVGAVLVVAGVPLIIDAFVRFVRAQGTPAPIAETAEMVVSGPYRRTRNPQYVGVVAVVAGEGLLWGSPRVLVYATSLALAFHGWVRIYEEPRLRHRFGAAYEHYTRQVPRWLGPVRRTGAESAGGPQAT